MATLNRQSKRGALIAEAVVASFLLVFAFLAATSLFDASLRWESQSSNLRHAALVAERKMEEIRALSARVPSGSTFAEHIDSIINSSHEPYDDAPGFTFSVTVLANRHKKVETSGVTPTDGVHSPNSTFYTEPTNPNATRRHLPPPSGPPYGAIDPDGDFQRNSTYNTYPYSRAMPNTYRLVKVTVNYSANSSYDLVSLIGDPILPAARIEPNTNQTVNVELLEGSTSIHLTGTAVLGVKVKTLNGSIVEDVSCLWGIHPTKGDGTVDLFALDGAGTRVRVVPRTQAFGFPPLSKAGTTVVVTPQIRYGGIKANAESAEIRL